MRVINKFKSIVIFSLSLLLFSCDFNGGLVPPAPNPTTPNSPTPANGATNVTNVVTLNWQTDGATSYDVYFDIANPPAKKVASAININHFTVVASGYSTAYYWKIVAKFADGSTKTGPVWSFTTKQQGTSDQGFVMIDHSISTQLPNFVNILFQVVDLNGVGIDNLTTSDFTLLEDNQVISPSESNMKIQKRQQNPYTLQTVLVLDNSTSLTGQISQIKSAALDFVNNMIAQQEVAVYEFSARTILLQDFTSDKTKLTAAINSYALGAPSTDLYGAVVEGASKMQDVISAQQINQSSMILFTDGVDTQGSTTLSEALNAISGKRVYTVGLGKEIDQDILQQLGNSGFYPIANTGQLSGAFSKILTELDKYANSFYWLNYSSPKEGNFDHVLQLSLNNNPYPSAINGTFSSFGFYHPDKAGIYVNASVGNPNGISQDDLSSGSSRTYKVVTYLGSVTPVYVWDNLSPSVLTVAPLATDSTQAQITATGNAGSVGLVKVTDTANSETVTFQINIK